MKAGIHALVILDASLVLLVEHDGTDDLSVVEIMFSSDEFVSQALQALLPLSLP